jgi:hypothetical protein
VIRPARHRSPTEHRRHLYNFGIANIKRPSIIFHAHSEEYWRGFGHGNHSRSNRQQTEGRTLSISRRRVREESPGPVGHSIAGPDSRDQSGFRRCLFVPKHEALQIIHRLSHVSVHRHTSVFTVASGQGLDDLSVSFERVFLNLGISRGLDSAVLHQR